MKAKTLPTSKKRAESNKRKIKKFMVSLGEIEQMMKPISWKGNADEHSLWFSINYLKKICQNVDEMYSDAITNAEKLCERKKRK